MGRSVTWLSEVERELRDVDKVSLRDRLAEVLDIPGDTLAEPTATRTRTVPTAPELLDGIRTALTSYGQLAAHEAPIAPLPQLQATLVEVHRSYQATRYERCARMLPPLLAGLDGYRELTGPVQAVRASAYVAAAKLLTKIGDADLAWLAADRAAMAALAADSPTTEGQAAYQVVCALLRTGQRERAELVAVGAAEKMMGNVGHDSPAATSLAGALWLVSAMTATSNADRRSVVERFAHADRLANRLGSDGNHAFTAFGPTNVALHKVSLSARMADPVRALTDAASVNTDAFPAGLVGRRAQLHLDLAQAQTQRRHDPEAVFHLREVERTAPELLRYYATAHAVVRELLRRERPTQTPELRPLAVRAGVL